MTIISKTQKQYFLLLMTNLDSRGKLDNGKFVGIETAGGLNLYPSDSPNQYYLDPALSLSARADIDRLKLLVPEYLSVQPGEGYTSGKVYAPTPAGTELYYQLITEEIVKHLEAFRHNNQEEYMMLGSITHEDIGEHQYKVSLATFNHCVERLKGEGLVAENPAPPERGYRRLYLLGAPAPDDSAEHKLVGDQYNARRDIISGNETVNIHNYPDGTIVTSNKPADERQS